MYWFEPNTERRLVRNPSYQSWKVEQEVFGYATNLYYQWAKEQLTEAAKPFFEALSDEKKRELLEDLLCSSNSNQ